MAQSTEVINVGVIGLGEQGWDNLLPSLAVIKQANIKAVCDLDEQKRSVAARNYGANAYDDFTTMLNKERLDAVIVASHPSVHKSVLEATIMRGIPTFVEKPPTLYTKELNDLVKLNQTHQTTTAVGLNFSFTEPIQFLKKIVVAPEFGIPAHLRVTHYGNKPSGVMWGLRSRARSFLLSQAIHPLGLLYDLGKPSGDRPLVHAYESAAGLFFDVNIQLIGAHGQPFTAELLTSSMSPFFEWQLQLVSNKGVIVNINSLLEIEVYSQHRHNPLIDNQKWWRDIWRPSPLSGGFKRNGYEHQFIAFFDSIRTSKPSITRIESMLPIYNLIDFMEKTCEQQDTTSTRKQVYQYQ